MACNCATLPCDRATLPLDDALILLNAVAQTGDVQEFERVLTLHAAGFGERQWCSLTGLAKSQNLLQMAELALKAAQPHDTPHVWESVVDAIDHTE